MLYTGKQLRDQRVTPRISLVRLDDTRPVSLHAVQRQKENRRILLLTVLSAIVCGALFAIAVLVIS